MHEQQTAMFLQSEKEISTDWLQLHHVIEDRGSKYSVTIGRVTNDDERRVLLERVRQEKKYKKATHHSYASRIQKGTQILDHKNDDGETGAGMAILRVLHRNNLINVVVVVTRWYGGVKLHGDRFKHVVDAAQEAIDQVIETR